MGYWSEKQRGEIAGRHGIADLQPILEKERKQSMARLKKIEVLCDDASINVSAEVGYNGVVKKFSELDLDPETVDGHVMGYMFEDLIRRFSTNAEAGDHYPAEWKTKKLRYATKLRNKSGYFSNGDIYIGLENIESSTGKYIQTETEYNEGFYDVVKKGDVLFGKLRPYLEKVYISEIDGFCTGEFLNFKEFEGDKRYLYYFLLSHGFVEIVNSSTYGAKMPRAEWDFIKNLKIPIPSPEEQQAIAAFLDS
jgi:hypothetical protein